eukprot:6179231-Pyramimonas_sp.AAC.1
MYMHGRAYITICTDQCSTTAVHRCIQNVATFSQPPMHAESLNRGLPFGWALPRGIIVWLC